MTKTERSRTDLALLSKRLGHEFEDWPEALTLQQIGLLISPTYLKRSDPGHELYERIQAAVKCGELAMDGPPVDRPCKVPDKQVAWFKVNAGGAIPKLGSPAWRGEGTPRLVQTYRQDTIQVPTARPQAVARVLQGRVLPELLATWIALGVEQCSESKNIPPGAVPQKTVMQKKHLLAALEVTYPELHSAFKRNDDWLKDCRAEQPRCYRLEDVEAHCDAKWPGRHRTPVAAGLNPKHSVRVIRGGRR